MKGLVRAYDACITALVAGAGLVLAAVCGLIAWDVVARNLGFAPPESTVALTEYALLYMTMAAAPALVRSRGHVVIGILHDRLPAGVRRWLDRLICLACSTMAFAVAVLAGVLAAEALALGEVDVRSMDIHRVWLFAPLVAGFGLTGTEFLRLLVRGEGVTRPVAERSSL
jgi:C4-dicarboxylate transporter DctQ subunit